jgi:hypothetical protein
VHPLGPGEVLDVSRLAGDDESEGENRAALLRGQLSAALLVRLSFHAKRRRIACDGAGRSAGLVAAQMVERPTAGTEVPVGEPDVRQLVAMLEVVRGGLAEVPHARAHREPFVVEEIAGSLLRPCVQTSGEQRLVLEVDDRSDAERNHRLRAPDVPARHQSLPG